MLWQPQALPLGIGLRGQHRQGGTASQVQPRAWPVGKLVHLGGATGSVFIEAHLAQTPGALLYAVRSQSYKGRHVLKCIDLRQSARSDVAREVNLQRAAAGPFVVEVEQPTYLVTQACFLLERGMGGTLEDALSDASNAQAPLPMELLLRWFDDVAQALHQCHVRGIVHRDVKPDNMVLTGGPIRAHWRVKLTDFGLATTFSDPPHAVGTITYMAPEVLRNQGATAAADMWSLGVTLYRMLVGIEPYYDDSAEAMALRLLRGTPQFTLRDLDAILLVRGAGTELRKRLVAVVAGLLELDPTKRTKLSALLASPLSQQL